MAGMHRTANRAKAKARRDKTQHRAQRRQLPASTWLGAGAVTLAVGAALAGGSGIAHAETSHSSTLPSSSDTSSSTGKTDSSSGSSGSTGSKADSTGAGSKAPKKSSLSNRTDIAPLEHTVSPPPQPQPLVSQTAPKTTALTTSSLVKPTTFSSVKPPTSSALKPTTFSAVKPTTQSISAASVITPSVSSPKVTAALVSAVTTDPPAPVTPSPFEGVVNFVANVLLALGGLNPANPQPNPANPLQLFLFSLASSLESSADPAPPAGTPIVAAADPNTGQVTGSAVFATDPSGDVTYSAPATSTGGGAVTVNATTAAFTYAPTQTQQLAAEAAGQVGSDTFTVTANDGLSTSTETVTVPVDPGTPQAGTPIVGKPNATTGKVLGNAVFTDPANGTLTYSAPATSTGGGTVTINASTGAFTYVPTPGQRQVATNSTTDTFTASASNGVHTGTETVTVDVAPNTTPTVISTIPVGNFAEPTGVAVTPDGTQIYVTNDVLNTTTNTFSPEVSVINTGTDAVTHIPLGANAASEQLAVTPNGNQVWVPNLQANTVTVINAKTNQVAATIPVAGDPVSVAFSPDGSVAYVTDQTASEVSVISTANDTVTTTVAVPSDPLGVAVGPANTPSAGNVYVTGLSVSGGTATGEVSVINPTTDAVTATIPVGASTIPEQVAVSPDGTRVYVTTNARVGTTTTFVGAVTVINAANNTVIATVPVSNEALYLAVSPDGSQVYVSNTQQGTVSVIDTATDAVSNTITIGPESATVTTDPAGVAFSPDGSLAYVANTTVNDSTDTVTGQVSVINTG